MKIILLHKIQSEYQGSTTISWDLTEEEGVLRVNRMAFIVVYKTFGRGGVAICNTE